jgi:Xaa-Pro aminopeptidase
MELAYPSRGERLRAAMRAADCDTAVLIGPGHAAHLAGYQRVWSGPIVYVAAGDGTASAVVPLYEVDAARRLLAVDDVEGYGEPGFGLDLKLLENLVATVARRLAGRRVGFASDMPGLADQIADRAGVEAVDLSGALAEIRLRKDPDEFERIARAYELALAGQAAVGRLAQPGISEIELYSAAQSTAQNEAGAPVDFGADMLVGERTALVCGPVATPGRRRTEPGDAIVSDVSVRHGGYWGDTARTFVVGENAEVHEALAGIQDVLRETAALLRPGARACDVFDQMARSIAERFPQGTFPHHAGHGVGVTGYEPPHLVPADETPLAEGMALAVEPGVYFPGRFGVRVENIYAVTPVGGVDLREGFGS